MSVQKWMLQKRHSGEGAETPSWAKGTVLFAIDKEGMKKAIGSPNESIEKCFGGEGAGSKVGYDERATTHKEKYLLVLFNPCPVDQV